MNWCGLRSMSGNQRALHLHHDPVALLERVVLVAQVPLERRDLVRHHRLGLRVAVAILGAEHLGADEHSIVAHALIVRRAIKRRARLAHGWRSAVQRRRHVVRERRRST